MKQDKHLLAPFLCKQKHTSPLPVQYAAPWEKKKGISEPISLDHSWSSFSVATQPLNWLAAQSAVAALLLPPPSPAPLGTFLSRWICRQVLMRIVAEKSLQTVYQLIQIRIYIKLLYRSKLLNVNFYPKEIVTLSLLPIKVKRLNYLPKKSFKNITTYQKQRKRD